MDSVLRRGSGSETIFFEESDVDYVSSETISGSSHTELESESNKSPFESESSSGTTIYDDDLSSSVTVEDEMKKFKEYGGECGSDAIEENVGSDVTDENVEDLMSDVTEESVGSDATKESVESYGKGKKRMRKDVRKDVSLDSDSEEKRRMSSSSSSSEKRAALRKRRSRSNTASSSKGEKTSKSHYKSGSTKKALDKMVGSSSKKFRKQSEVSSGKNNSPKKSDKKSIEMKSIPKIAINSIEKSSSGDNIKLMKNDEENIEDKEKVKKNMIGRSKKIFKDKIGTDVKKRVDFITKNKKPKIEIVEPLREYPKQEMNEDEGDKVEFVGTDVKLENVPTCLVARTCLILPFKWSEDTVNCNMQKYISGFTSRKIAANGRKYDLWYEDNRKDKIPKEAFDLDPHFLTGLGIDVNATKNGEYDICRRLKLTHDALDILFPNSALEANDSGKIRKKIIITKVEVTLFPMAAGVIVFSLDWIIPDEYLSLDDFRSWLYISRFRITVQNVFNGWILDVEPLKEKADKDELETIGPSLCSSLFQQTPISISEIGNWLLKHNSEGVAQERIGRFQKRCYHHSVVVIDSKPENLSEYLFHLSRGYGQRNRPPPTLENEMILNTRRNRNIAISRTGTISLSWPLDSRDNFEVLKWWKKFNGIYILIAVHVFGEKTVLNELSYLSADAGELLRLLINPKIEMRDLIHIRLQLFTLATLLTRYTIEMSSDECGGLTEYVEFFKSLREIFNIRSTRAELREEIHDVLTLVESSYLEEQRNQTEEEKRRVLNAKNLQKQIDRIKDFHQERFQNTIAVVTSFTLPLALVSAIFGMNLTTLPQYPFWETMLLTTIFSIVLLICILLLLRFQKVKLKKAIRTLN